MVVSKLKEDAKKNLPLRKQKSMELSDRKSAPSSTNHVLRISSITAEFDIDDLLDNLLQYVEIADELKHIEKQEEYVVQIPLDFQKDFADGVLRLNENTKTGTLWPTLYKTLDNGKRQIVANLPIKKQETIWGNQIENIVKNITTCKYSSSYMNWRIQCRKHIGLLNALNRGN